MFNITGKVALVTGSASGIGFEIAKQLLGNGARGVVLADVDAQAGKIACEKLSEEYGKAKVVFLRTDVSDKVSFEDAFKLAISEFKNIDILVNNAGICDEKNYERGIAVNLTGTIHGSYLALENYILNHRTGIEGVIINTSSDSGCYGFPGAPVYAATKSAIINLTLTWGSEVYYENTKIKVVCIAPGSTTSNIRNNSIMRNEYYDALANEFLSQDILQSAEFVAKKMMKIIEEKPSGTVWICANNKELYEYIPAVPIKL